MHPILRSIDHLTAETGSPWASLTEVFASLATTIHAMSADQFAAEIRTLDLNGQILLNAVDAIPNDGTHALLLPNSAGQLCAEVALAQSTHHAPRDESPVERKAPDSSPPHQVTLSPTQRRFPRAAPNTTTRNPHCILANIATTLQSLAIKGAVNP